MRNNKLTGGLLLGLVFVFNISVFGASLSGTYSIGSNSADYASIQDAVTDLVNNGVSGPCEFLIQDGDYDEQVIISQIQGTSPINRVLFKSASNDSSKVKLKYTSNSTYNYVVKINQADYISFESIEFVANSSSHPRIFKLWEGVRGVTWKSCLFDGANSSSFVNGYEALISGQTSSKPNESLIIESCTFNGGSFGIHLQGISSNVARDLKIENNRFINQGTGGVKVYLFRGGLIENNYFALNRGVGIDLHTDSTTIVSKNRIDIASTVSAGKGVYISNHSSTGGLGYTVMSNNVINVDFGSGVVVYNSDYFLMYHNTIYTKNNGIYFSLDVTLSDTFDISNNIIINASSYGVAKLEGNLGKNEYMNNNCFYSLNSTPLLYNGQNYSLNNWKSASGKDQSSFYRNVNFVDLNNYEVSCSEAEFLSSSRDLTLSVPDDKIGKTRVHQSTIGAYEGTNSTGLIGIKGYVTSGLDTIRAGFVEVFGDTSSQVPLDFLGSTQIDADGSFEIQNVPNVSCWIKIIPDTLAYPLYLISFHDGSLRHENAVELHPDYCDGLSLDVHPRKLYEIQFNGEGNVSGFITNYSLSSKTMGTDPIPGLDVVLDKKPPSKTVAKVQTDALGRYEFADLPEGNYQVSVEYKGLPIDTLYEIEIVGSDTIHSHLDYCIDTLNQIQGCYAEIDGNEEVVSFTGVVYPNPFNNQLNIEAKNTVKKVNLISFDGRIVRETKCNDKNIQLDLSSLPIGVYLLEVEYGNEMKSFVRIIKQK